MSDTSRPILAIEHDQLHAAERIVASIVWPHDPVRRDYALATWGADALAKLRKSGEQQAEKEASEIVYQLAVPLAEKYGVPIEEALQLPAMIQAAATMRGSLIVTARDTITAVFEQAGGLEGVALAPGLGVLEAELVHVRHARLRIVGYALLYVYTMAKRHPELSPSLTRAWAIMAVEKAFHSMTGKAELPEGVRDVPSDPAVLKNMWTKDGWGAVAPMSASFEFLVAWVTTPGNPNPASAISRDEIFSPRGLQKWLSWAKWLRQWALTHKAPRSSTTLLKNNTAMEIVARVPASEPPVGPLAPLQWWAAYEFRQDEARFDPAKVAADFDEQKVIRLMAEVAEKSRR